MVMKRSQIALEAASSFLAPVLAPEFVPTLRGLSVLQRLSLSKESSSDVVLREQVICQALSLLSDIHDALESEYDSEDSINSNSTETLIDPTASRTIHGLLDLISIEGIYPSLSPDVGLPLELRVKSAISKAGTTSQNVVIDQVFLRDSLLPKISNTILPILLAGPNGIGRWIQERIFVDVLALTLELAFNPGISNKSKIIHQASLDSLIDGSLISTLYPALTSLLRADAPAWLRPQVARILSLLPTRPSGVRQTIEFISSRAHGAQLPEENGESHKTSGPRIHLDTLTQASRLLASVPTSLTATKYYDMISPQLFSLLDGESGSDMSKVAGYIIGKGILSRAVSGAIGTTGYKVFAETILSSINPGKSQQRSEDPTELGTIVSESRLDLALRRLATILDSHPNPALARRLLSDIIRPIWALLVYSKGTTKLQSYERARFLLYTYYSNVADSQALALLSGSLMYDGEETWTFAAGDEGGVEIRHREQVSEQPTITTATYASLDVRIEEFLQLVASESISDSLLGPVFARVTHDWLRASRTNDDSHIQEASGSGIQTPLQALINARLLQGMLDRVKERLARSPTQILELVKELLSDFMANLKQSIQLGKQNENPTLQGLGRIVNDEIDREGETTDETFEAVTLALSLLGTTISSPHFHSSKADRDIMFSIHDIFNSLVLLQSSLPQDLTITISNMRELLQEYSTDSDTRQQPSEVTKNVVLEDRRAFALCQTYITDSLPPVRAQGLTILKELIDRQSPIIDIPVTGILLLSLLQDPEEYIYLFAIRILDLLASKHPRSVIRMLSESYQDSSESLTLDQRLRLGEALERIMTNSRPTYESDTVQLIGRTCLAIASRRGQRPKAAATAVQESSLQQRKQKEAEQAWGGEVPSLDAENDPIAERLARTLEGWQGKGGEEDVRIRTSALSILTTAIEADLARLGPDMASTVLDLSLAILTQEPGDDRAILRRAAVLVVFGIIKALDRAGAENRDVGFGFAGVKLDHVLRILRYVVATDGDDLVRGHARDVLDGLSDWKVNALGLEQSRRQLAQESLLADGSIGHLAGLDIRPGSGDTKIRIEEVE